MIQRLRRRRSDRVKISGHFRVWAGVVSVAVLVVGLPSSVASATKDSVTKLPPGTIVNQRFVKSWKLSDGSLTLSSFAGALPTLSTAERTRLLATQGIDGTLEGIGFADVTVTRSKTVVMSGPTLSSLNKTPSLVGLTRGDEVLPCPVLKPGEGTSFIPSGQGWHVVIFPLNVKMSDVVFSAASNVCGRLTKNTLSAAYEVVSVPWHLEADGTTGSVIVASVPRCGTITMSGGGGNESTRQFEYQVEVDVLDRLVGTTCTPAANVDEGPDYASPSTIHGFTGPVLSTGPYAGDVMTSKGPKAQLLA